MRFQFITSSLSDLRYASFLNESAIRHCTSGISARFVNIDHNTPLLIPPDPRDWVTPEHLLLVITDAVKALDLSQSSHQPP